MNERAPLVELLYQSLIGFLIVPAFSRSIGNRSSDWRLVPFFLMVLIAVRVVPAVVRHTVSFSSERQARWFRQRALAKRYDSYQWRKLFWFGLGLAAYVALFDRADTVAGLLSLTCVGAGALGLLAWRRVAQMARAATGRLPN
jgi:hypothetical protein